MVVWMVVVVVVEFARTDGEGEQYFIFPSDPELSPCNQQSRYFRRRSRPETETLFCLQFVQRTLPAYVSFVSSSPKFSMKIAVYQAKTSNGCSRVCRDTTSGIFLYFFPRFPLLGRFYLSPPRTGKFVLANYFSALALSPTKFGTYRADPCLDRLVYFHFSCNFARFPKMIRRFLTSVTIYHLPHLFNKLSKCRNIYSGNESSIKYRRE